MGRFYSCLLPASSQTSRDCNAAIAGRSRNGELRLHLGVCLRSVVTNLEGRAAPLSHPVATRLATDRRVPGWPEHELAPRLEQLAAALEAIAKLDPVARLLRDSLVLDVWLLRSSALSRSLFSAIEASLADVYAEESR